MSENTGSNAPASVPGDPVGHLRGRGAGIGLLSAGLAIGVGELVAAVVAASGPVTAVGSSAIDLAPTWLKEFAIRAFGTADKPVLITGIFVVLAFAAVALGIIGLRRPRVAYAGLAVFGLIGIGASLSRPDAAAVDVLAPILGTLAGAWAFRLLRRWAVAELPTREPADAETVPSMGEPMPAPRAKVVATDRRGFLKAAGLIGGAAVLSGFGGRVVASRSAATASRAGLRLPAPESTAAAVPPGAQLDVPGLEPFITPNADFYRIDTSLITPNVPVEGWTLKIHGMVERPMELTFDQLVARPMIERDVTLACVSNEVGGNYIGNARWIGVPLTPLLEEAGVRPGADQMVTRSVDGFTIGTPSDLALDGRDAMLAVQMNGEPLPIEHGFPVRMVIPGLYGYNSAMKWISEIEMSTFDTFDAYWVRRGWAEVAPVLTQSRIDTPASLASRPAGPVAVAGVAWAQHRGVSGVEVRVDEGAWQQATLGAEDTIDTWRQWVYEWDATPGRHLLQVRATDGDGEIQTGERAEPFPSGATGWHTVSVEIT